MRTAPLALVLPFTLAWLAFPPTAKAQNEVGRYQMTALPNKPGSFDSKVIILDTSTGELWQWWEAPAVGSSVPSSGISYLGKVAAGAASSQLPPLRRSNPMEPILPKHQ